MRDAGEKCSSHFLAVLYISTGEYNLTFPHPPSGGGEKNSAQGREFRIKEKKEEKKRRRKKGRKRERRNRKEKGKRGKEK